MSREERQVLGWREWLALPDLGIPAIKAKIDTGARTSAIHAARVETVRRKGVELVRFHLHPVRSRPDIVVHGEAPILDRRIVSDSGGHREERVFVRTRLVAGGHEWPIEINLTDRETMLFPMLLGRTAMAGRVLVEPEHSYLLGRPSDQLAAEYPDAQSAGGGS